MHSLQKKKILPDYFSLSGAATKENSRYGNQTQQHQRHPEISNIQHTSYYYFSKGYRN
jgi:hypothetical protein